jgi:hypothetical protein
MFTHHTPKDNDEHYLAFMDREKPQAERPLLDQHTPRREVLCSHLLADEQLRAGLEHTENLHLQQCV